MADYRSPILRRWQRLLLHALLVVAWFVCNGYCFGVADHVLHLPFLDLARNPGFLANDYLLGHTSHPSLFWLLQIPLVALLRIDYVYFAIHVASVWTLVGGMLALTKALYPGRSEDEASWLAASLSIVGYSTMAGINSFDSLVLNRTVVLGAELWALALVVRRRPNLAFLLVGLAFDIHATTAVHTGLLVFVVGMSSHGTRLRTLLATPWFVVAASPLLILSVGSHGSVPWPAPAEWFAIVWTAFPYHHFYRLLSSVQYMYAVLPIAVILAAGRSRPQRQVAALVMTSVLVCILHVFITSVLQWPVAVQLHLLEITRFLPFFASAAIGDLLANGGAIPWHARARRPWIVAAAFVAFGACSLQGRETFAFWRDAVAPSVLLLSAVWQLDHRDVDVSPSTWRWPQLALVPMVLAVVTFAIRPDNHVSVDFASSARGSSEYLEAWKLPPDEVSGQKVMRWAKAHLPRNAIVATPPYFDHSLTALRHEAGVAMLGTFKDGGEGTFDLAFAKEWKARMIAVSGTEDLFDRVDPPAWWWSVNKERALVGWRWADTGRLRMLASRFGATHVITETQLHRGSVTLPVLYVDSAFVIYSIAASR